MLRRNTDSIVIPYDTRAFDARVNADDSILSIAERLASFGGGGTDCSVPLREVNKRHGNRRFAGVVLISDNESWVYQNRPRGYGRRGATGVLTEWQAFVKSQMQLGGHDIPSPKLVCIDIQPYDTTQAPERDDILNIGGFSDAVFNVVSAFLDNDANRFVAEVESIKL